MADGARGLRSRLVRRLAASELRSGNDIATIRQNPETELTAPSTEARRRKRGLVIWETARSVSSFVCC